MTRDPRSTYRYRTLRAAWLPNAGDLCWYCGKHVPRNVDPLHPLSPTVDHAIEVDARPDLALDVRLWRLAHRGCNATRGNHYREARDAGTASIVTSRRI